MNDPTKMVYRSTIKKYSYNFDYASGFLVKPEIWVNEEIDRLYYSDLNKLIDKSQQYQLYLNAQIEKNLNIPDTYCPGFKIINRNPNFIKK